MSDRKIVLVGLATCAFFAQAVSAQIFVFPGDTVNIPTPIANADVNGNPGGATINSIKLTVSPQSGFVTSASDSSTESLTPGEVKTFTPSFVVDPTAADGTYTVTLKVVSSDTGIDPDPSSSASDIQVNFIVATGLPSAAGQNAYGRSIGGAMSSTECFTAKAVDTASGIASISFGPKGGSMQTYAFLCGVPPISTQAYAGAFCGLTPNATYTLTVTNCAGVQSQSDTLVKDGGSPAMQMCVTTPQTTSCSTPGPAWYPH